MADIDKKLYEWARSSLFDSFSTELFAPRLFEIKAEMWQENETERKIALYRRGVVQPRSLRDPV
jgi:hypothetical protein